MLELVNIRKTYSNKENPYYVLNRINLKINDGEVFGLIGVNGAGKSTLLNIIGRVISASEGEVLLDGKVINGVHDISGKIGFVIDVPSVYDYLTAREYMEFLASAERLDENEINKRTDLLLDMVGLNPYDTKRIKQYSRGMCQRFSIACALLLNPKIIIMDEPASALDPLGRHDIEVIIKKLKESGKTVILSTHILSDVEKVCDRVAMLNNGNITYCGSIAEILQDNSKPYYDITLSDISNFGKAKEELSKIEGVVSIELNNLKMTVVTKGDKDYSVDIMGVLIKNKIEIISLGLRKVNLEDVFIQGGQNNGRYNG